MDGFQFPIRISFSRGLMLVSGRVSQIFTTDATLYFSGIRMGFLQKWTNFFQNKVQIWPKKVSGSWSLSQTLRVLLLNMRGLQVLLLIVCELVSQLMRWCENHFYKCPNSYHENSPSVLIHVYFFGLSLEELEGDKIAKSWLIQSPKTEVTLR